MADLSVLPRNWREKADQMPDFFAKKYRNWGRGKVWVEDDCPMELSIIVVDEDENVFRLVDPIYTLLILKALKFSPEITEIYDMTHIPTAVEILNVN